VVLSRRNGLAGPATKGGSVVWILSSLLFLNLEVHRLYLKNIKVFNFYEELQKHRTQKEADFLVT